MLPLNRAALIKVSAVVMSSLAVVHIACWASCIVLGVVAVWTRLQYSQGWESTIYGSVGLAIWASLPFAICGILSVAATKTRSFKVITWYMLSSMIAVLFSISVLTYSLLAVIQEAGIEILPKRLIVASVTSFVSFVEIVVSTISFIICHRAIGWSLQFKCKTSCSKPKFATFRSKVGPSCELEDGHVTVMAMPARQATELFINMYRPYLNFNPTLVQPGMEGFQTGEITNHFPEAPTENQRLSSPEKVSHLEDRRRHRKRHHRRPYSRNNSPDDSILGIPPDPNAIGDMEEFDSGSDGMNRPPSATDGTFHRFQADDAIIPQMHSTRPYSQSRLATVIEDEHDTGLSNENDQVASSNTGVKTEAPERMSPVVVKASAQK